eukprot:4914747-Prymnesium_polylepis.1
MRVQPTTDRSAVMRGPRPAFARALPAPKAPPTTWVGSASGAAVTTRTSRLFLSAARSLVSSNWRDVQCDVDQGRARGDAC